MEFDISALKSLCDNSCPPLKPIANKRYNEINLEDDSGMVKSLLTIVAIMPNKKIEEQGL